MINIVIMTEEQKAARQQDLEKATNFVNSYTGYSSYIRNVRDWTRRGYGLTVRQVECILKIIDSEAVSQAGNNVPMTNAPYVNNSSFQEGDIVTLNKVMAEKLGMMVGFGKRFYNITIKEVLAETPSYIEARVETCYRKSSWCGCCGLKLTDPQSIAAGIGPVCARSYKIKQGPKSLEELDRLLGKKELPRFRIWKRGIKNHHKVKDESQAA